jgi:hypothetical protein
MPLFNAVETIMPRRATQTGLAKLVVSCRETVKRLPRTACISSALVILLAGCSQNSAAARKQTLERFCSSVAQHILDRNPNTISESLSTLMHEELSDAARQKLEDTKVIPDSPITVLREKADWVKGHKSNRVDVGIIRALTPIEAKDVTFRVSGKDWDLVDGKQTDFHTFQFDMVAELTPDMDGLARVLEIQGLGKTPIGASVASAKDDSAKGGASKRKRRR